MMRQLYTMNLRGLNTIAQFIPVYAPSNENPTASYIVNLANMMGIHPWDVINWDDKSEIISLIHNMSIKESGESPSTALINDVYNQMFYNVDPITNYNPKPRISLPLALVGSLFLFN